MSRLVIFMAAAAVLVSCGTRTQADGTSGVTGVVLAGPQCPVVTAESPCPDEPFVGSVVALEGDEEVARVQTDSEGRFRMSLPPGSYTLAADLEPGLPFAEPSQVQVTEGTYVEVTLLVDTGIR
jgi:hypothetical protein